jgi:polyhydroxybutyrate depolymerase
MATTRTSGTRTVAIVLILISLPMVLAAVEALSYYRHNRNTGTIVSSGRQREYIVHVPKTYDPAKPTPLVISMHGAGLWPAVQRDMTQWNTVADAHGIIVVYPLGLGLVPVWQMRGGEPWQISSHEPGLPRDARFIADLIDTLAATHNIDPRRIYADGLSNGAGMAFVLSCTLADRIAAVGLVSSALLLPFDSCASDHAVPMIAFHGTHDPVAPYDGGTSWVAPVTLPAVPSFADAWSRRNRCAPNPVEAAVAADVSRRAYHDCANGADVVLYTVKGGGHTWPGGGPMPEWFVGPNTHSVSATNEIWAFFRDHPLR